MRRGATVTPCPEPRRFDYGDLSGDGVEDDAYDATCEGSRDHNGFYGDGIVSATGLRFTERSHRNCGRFTNRRDLQAILAA